MDAGVRRELQNVLEPTISTMRALFAREGVIYMHLRDMSLPKGLPSDIAEEVFQFWGRTEVRMVFAQLEGLTHSLKQASLGCSEITRIQLTPAEKAFLEEQDYDLQDNGVIVSRSAKLRTLPNFLFAVRQFAKTTGITYQLPTNGTEWQKLKEAIKVRDRLTHPRDATSLTVTHEELGSMFDALIWVYENIDQMVSLAIGAQEEPSSEDNKTSTL